MCNYSWQPTSMSEANCMESSIQTSQITETMPLTNGSSLQLPLKWYPWQHPQIRLLLNRIAQPLFILHNANTELGYALPDDNTASDACTFVGYVPGCTLERLGDGAFSKAHSVRYNYYAGAMANGIASVELVSALAKDGFLGIFGSAGLELEAVAQAIKTLHQDCCGPFGVNFIHSPNEPELESALVDLYIQQEVRLVEASAFLDLTLPIVRYRVMGIYRDAAGNIFAPNKIIAKVSRVEVARKFMEPPPDKYLRQLVQRGDITEIQAEMASQIPMAEDITAEADSGGHTDNRPAIALFPTMLALRDQIQSAQHYSVPVRVGLAGGIATPASVAAAFAMGAAYVVTGTINQACVESGSSDLVREMLAEAEQADVIMAPAADMFEMGVNVQVLKRGSMFSMRGARLYQIYKTCSSLDMIPAEERVKLEKTVFRASFEEIWESTREFFLKRAPGEISRAENDPKHKMALVFRSYLGQASRWANQGVADRKIDFQVWCGPAMGAFNEWTRGSYLELVENRQVSVVAKNLLYGAALIARINSIRQQGFNLPETHAVVGPVTPQQLEEYLH